MSEYAEVEQPFLRQLETLGWSIVDQGPDIPREPDKSLRQSFRQWILPDVFAKSVSSINKTEIGEEWLTKKQLHDLHDQILRQPNRTLLEANEAIQKLLFKAQVDVNEITGELDPVVKLMDFEIPENNRFHAVNQFRIDTPGGVKQFIIPDIVLFVNGGSVNIIQSSGELRTDLSSDTSDINMVMAHKFQQREESLSLKVAEALGTWETMPPGKSFGEVNDSDPYRVPAKRFGYILRIAKERYKDTSLDLGDAGEKVKDLINAHLISLGINPMVPPVELLADDFMEKLNRHFGMKWIK